VEKLPSGRYRVRWTDGDGVRGTVPQTFATIVDAHAYLATIKVDMLREVCRGARAGHRDAIESRYAAHR
jgi:hypothetical protein